MDFLNNNRTTQYGPMAQGFMARVYSWMCGGLFFTGFMAYLVSPDVNPKIFMALMNGPIWVLMFALLGISFYFSAAFKTMSYSTAVALFIAYAGLNGIFLSPLFAVYTQSSLFFTFASAAGMFGIMALYGMVTRQDLSSLGNILFMGMIGLIICNLVNMFVKSASFDLGISFVGVAIFTLLTAYQVQQLKMFSRFAVGSDEEFGKFALLGAFSLYLNLINIFLYLLRFMGEKKRN